MINWLSNVAAAISQFINALTCGNRDQSFSSRSYEARLYGKAWAYIAVPLINLVMLSKTHCLEAYTSDTERTYS